MSILPFLLASSGNNKNNYQSKIDLKKACRCPIFPLLGLVAVLLLTNYKLRLNHDPNIRRSCERSTSLHTGSLILASLSGIRLAFEWSSETESSELWVPRDSDFYINKKWLRENYPSSTRGSFIIVKVKDDSQNILTNENLKFLLKIHQVVGSVKTNENVTYSDICR